MALYRLTFQTQILVDAPDMQTAEGIGFENLGEEIRNTSSTYLYAVKQITSTDQLLRGERGSLPWRAAVRSDPELRVEEILGGT